jgi:hypothetical protein
MRFFWPEKILPRFFHLRENHKKQKISYFWLPHQQMGSMTGIFPMTEFNTSYTITHRNFVRIREKIFFPQSSSKIFLPIELQHFSNLDQSN